MARVIVFDVNETLLSLRDLDPHFARIFGDAKVMSQWFSQLLRSALVATLTNAYRDFQDLGSDALEMIAMRHGIALSAADRAAIAATMRRLSPHP